MSMEDFLANFDYLDICHVLESPSNEHTTSGSNTLSLANHTSGGPENKITRAFPSFFGRWVRGVTAGGRPFVRASHWANPQYVVRIPTPDMGDPEGLAALVVALLQADSRPLRHRAPQLLSIGFVLYRLPPGANPPMTRHFFETNNHVASVDFFYDSREVVKRFRLVPGIYLLIPCTYAADKPGEFLLRVLFEQADRTLECALGQIDAGSIMPQALSDPDPQFEAITPRIRRLFYEAGGDSMAVDAFQLDSILNTILKEDHRLPYTMLTTDACRALISMQNDHYTGKLVESQFQGIWGLLRCWSRMFASFDPQRSGFITCLDFRILIEQIGLYLPHTILARIVHRFADAEWRISYGTFVQIMALLTKAMTNFSASSGEGSRIILNLEEYLEALTTA